MKKLLIVLSVFIMSAFLVNPVYASGSIKMLENIDMEEKTMQARWLDPFNRKVYDKSYGVGMYKVGEDIEPGFYKIFVDENKRGYYEVSSDSRGDSIIHNGGFSSFVYIVINEGEYLSLSRAFAVQAEQVPPHRMSSITDGMYRVGYDIEAREYQAFATEERGYYAILDGDNPDNIINNGGFERNVYITVVEGEILQLSRAKISLK